MPNDVFRDRARLRIQSTGEPHATAKSELRAFDANAPVIPPAADPQQALFEAQVFARLVRAFGGLVPASVSAVGRFGLRHVSPRPNELEVRVDPEALPDVLGVLAGHNSPVMASYGVPGLRCRYERRRLMLRQPGLCGRIVLAPVPQPAWAKALERLEKGVPPRSRLLFTDSDDWTPDELDAQDADEEQLGGYAGYLSALFRRVATLRDQELRVCLDQRRFEAVVDSSGAALRPWSGAQTPVELLSADEADDAASAGPLEQDEGSVLERGLLQEVARSALERAAHLDAVGPAGGELFALVDPRQLPAETTSALRPDVEAVISERDGRLCEMPLAAESGDYLRMTSSRHLVPVAGYTEQERETARAWVVPVDFTDRTDPALFAAPPARRMPNGDELFGFDSPEELWARTAGARMGPSVLALLFLRPQERPPHPDKPEGEIGGWPNAIVLSRSGQYVNAYRMPTGWIEVTYRRMGDSRFLGDDVAHEVCRQLLSLPSPDEDVVKPSWAWVLLWMEALKGRRAPLEPSRATPPERLNDYLYGRVALEGQAAWQPVWEAVETGRLRQWRLGTEDVAWRDGPGFLVLLTHLIDDVVVRVERMLAEPGRFTDQGAAYVREVTTELGLDLGAPQ
ncbi:hypothetical protein [Streptomyces sp. XH2]|uniref:hypothetical protein n=1 Tax=Streptomyces sp. XH2 TaxID=3412483 RepID=UPI003C7D6D2D